MTPEHATNQRRFLEAGCFTRKRMRELGCSDADIARIEAAAAERRGGVAPASTPQLALFDPQTVPF